jgi:WD40 repeat protein
MFVNDKNKLSLFAGLSLSPDGNYVLSNSMDNTARIWVRPLFSRTYIGVALV